METRLTVGAGVEPGPLRALAGQHDYGPHLEDWTLPTEGARRLLHDEIANRPADGDHGSAVTLSAAGEPLGLLVFRRSSWDSEHFGFPVGAIDRILTARLDGDVERQVVAGLLEAFESWRAEAGLRFVFARVPARHLAAIQGLERHGFGYIETYLWNRVDLARVKGAASASFRFRPARPEDLETLVGWSRGAFSTQRFHADPNIDPTAADALYERWIRTSLGDAGRQTVVAEAEGTPLGFFDHRARDLRPWLGARVVFWRMFLLDPERRGQGLGGALLAAFLQTQKEAGLDRVQSGLTLRNVRSSNLHARAGFDNVAFGVTLHRWWRA